jgi:hypothetical protein
MTDVQIDPRTTDSDTGDDTLVHVGCCRDRQLALCGCKSELVYEGSLAGDEMECITCLDAERKGTCPKFRMCPEDKAGNN